MARSSMQKQKLLYLQKIMLQKTDESHGLTISEIKSGYQYWKDHYPMVIEKIEVLEDGSILVNDDVELRKSGEEYHVYVYETEYIEQYVELEVEIPDNLKITDNIDRETGDPLDEPVIYTAEEFRAMLADENLSPDFATDNVKVAFNVNCEMVSVERFYTPAQ